MAKEVLITAKVPADEKKGTKEMNGQVTVNYGDTAAECIEMFSDEAVKSNSFANWRVTVQGNIRSALKRGVTPEALQDLLGASKMGVAQAGATVNPVEAYIAQFASATPEKQAEMLKDLQAGAKKRA